MNIDLFKKCMGSFVTGVSIVTSLDKNQPFGITINSFTSLSLNPQLILFCLDKNSFAKNFFQLNDNFIVNILSEDQEKLSIAYAFENHYDFSKFPHEISADKIPLFDQTMTNIECSVKNRYNNGDHFIIIGKVNKLTIDESKKPLVYFKGNYTKL